MAMQLKGVRLESRSPSFRPKLSTAKSSHSPHKNGDQPSTLAEAVSSASIHGGDPRLEAGEIQAGRDILESKGGRSEGPSMFFRAHETKEAEAFDYVQDVDTSSKSAVEEDGKEFLPAGEDEVGEGGGEGGRRGGGGQSNNAVVTWGMSDREARASVEPPPAPNSLNSSLDSSSSDDNRVIGEGSEGGREDGGGGGEEERREIRRVAAAVAIATGLGFEEPVFESDRATATNAAAAETVAMKEADKVSATTAEAVATTVPETDKLAATTTPRPPASAAAAAVPVVADGGGPTAERLRPPPITTNDVPPILRKRSSQVVGTGHSGETNNDDGDPEKMRRCFVAKTFSPSDLGLGMLHGGGDGGDGTVREVMTKATLMKKRRRKRTISKGTGINGRRGTVDEVLGLDDQQAVLGSVPPERLFSITGMFHPEAPVKVRTFAVRCVCGNPYHTIMLQRGACLS